MSTQMMELQPYLDWYATMPNGLQLSEPFSLLSAQTKPGFFRFIEFVTGGDISIYRKSHLTSKIQFRNFHSVDLPNNAIDLAHCLD